jgi:predicted DNA-binding transcriptional regulator YafY
LLKRGETGKKMYYATSRVLAALDLLQNHGRMRGEDIAARLEVNVRTVRRYALILRERGIPVEMKRGRHGGYSLPSGYRQPLALTREEALALTYGLLSGGQQALGLDKHDTVRTLRKVTRVLPSATRDLIAALDGAVTFATPQSPNATGEAPGCLDTLVQAIQERHRLRLVYRAQTGARSERAVDPYQVVYRAGRWYLVGYCHLRADLRVFRLDHIQHARALGEAFTPQTVDAIAAVERAIAQAPWRWEFAVLADAPIETLRTRMPATTATLHPQAERVVLLQGYADDLDILACTLAALRCPLVILRPDELRESVRVLADRLKMIADQPATSCTHERKEK